MALALQDVVDWAAPFVYEQVNAVEDRVTEAISEATKSILERNRKQFEGQIQYGTVTGIDGGRVSIELDVDGVVIQSYATVGDLQIDDRVAVMLVPPNGALVLGRIVDLGTSGFLPRFDPPTTAVNKLQITDTTNENVTNGFHHSIRLTDNRTWSSDQTGANPNLETPATLSINVNPIIPAGLDMGRFDAVNIRSADLPPAAQGSVVYPATTNITEWNALGLHWNALVGVTHNVVRGAYLHTGANLATIQDGRGMEFQSMVLVAAQYQKATALWYADSYAQRSWGFRIGGNLGGPTDAFPSYHRGPIGMGGPLTSGSGNSFDPIAMLDIRQVDRLIRTFNIKTTLNSPIIQAEADVPPNLFDYPFDSLATVASSALPGGQSTHNGFVAWGPKSMTVLANALNTSTTSATVTKSLNDRMSSGIIQTPGYDGPATVVRHNYQKIANPALTGGAGVTNACVWWFDAAANVHKALKPPGTATVGLGAVGPVGATATPRAWIQINLNGTIGFLAVW